VKHKKGELQEPAIGTLIHSCWIKIQRPDLGQYSIGTVGQYSVGANNLNTLALAAKATYYVTIFMVIKEVAK
jgi:hypothetical protein